MENWKETLTKYYIERHAVAVGTFTLTGGSTSNFYVDGRAITTYPPALRIIASVMKQMILERNLLPENGNLVAPVLSAVPIGAVLALDFDIPYIIDRVTQKSHGLSKRFEGHFTSSDYCLVIDDTITRGTTLIKTIIGLREIGKSVTDAVVVVDREEGGREALAEHNVHLHHLLTKRDLINALEGSNTHGK